MNFIPADFILTLEHREDVLERLQERNARIDKAMDTAIAKRNLSADYVQAYYKHRGFDQDGKPV